MCDKTYSKSNWVKKLIVWLRCPNISICGIYCFKISILMLCPNLLKTHVKRSVTPQLEELEQIKHSPETKSASYKIYHKILPPFKIKAEDRSPCVVCACREKWRMDKPLHPRWSGWLSGQTQTTQNKERVCERSLRVWNKYPNMAHDQTIWKNTLKTCINIGGQTVLLNWALLTTNSFFVQEKFLGLQKVRTNILNSARSSITRLIFLRKL